MRVIGRLHIKLFLLFFLCWWHFCWVLCINLGAATTFIFKYVSERVFFSLILVSCAELGTIEDKPALFRLKFILNMCRNITDSTQYGPVLPEWYEGFSGQRNQKKVCGVSRPGKNHRWRWVWGGINILEIMEGDQGITERLGTTPPINIYLCQSQFYTSWTPQIR